MKKRSVERIPTDLTAEFIWSDRVNAGSVADLSENGMFIKTGRYPPLRAKFELSFPVEDDIVKIPVKVRRLRKKDHYYDGMGLEILNPPQKYLDFVTTLRWKRIKGNKTNGQVVKLYVCRMCHHIAFDHAPVNCPICSATIESFEKAPEAIKRPDNFSELSEFEKKHIPVIRLSKETDHVETRIMVGEIRHKMDIDDHISHIDLYYNAPLLNKKCISRISFNCDRMYPSATVRFDNTSNGVLTVISNCSAHGNWLARAKL